MEHKRVETKDELDEALSNESWDIVITDHNLPTLNSFTVLDTLNEFKLDDLSLIVLSGNIDQNTAVESMRMGARDYIMKNDMTRLIPAIERELQESKLHKELRDSEAKNKRNLQAILDHSPAIISVKDTDGCYTFINHRFEQIFDIKSKDIIGKTDHEIFPKDNADNFVLIDKKVLESGIAQKLEEVIPHDDGDHTYVSNKFPLYDDSNTIFSVCSISTDITDHKQQEELLRRSQKMEAIGQLSGGIAHDFNNQLGIIIGYLDFLKNHLVNEEKQLKWVNTASKATLRCMDLTRQLLSFSRRKATSNAIVDINTIFNELETIISRSVTPEVEIQYHLADQLWLAETDPAEFQDVILNLVINARDAMPNGGKLLFETKNLHLDTDYAYLAPGIAAGDYVQLMLSDTGSGMDRQTLEHVFEPFFTTKPKDKGTGLGLSMVYGFIKRHNGYIKVYSEPGKGTTFRLYFPRSETSKTTITEQDDFETDLPEGNESILIVDDEVDLLQLADTFLSSLGYNTYLATNASEALEILEQEEDINLLFSDVVMPGGINGYELAQKATQQYPELKVLLTSGYTSKAITNNGMLKFSSNLLTKPYRKSILAQKVRQIFDK